MIDTKRNKQANVDVMVDGGTKCYSSFKYKYCSLFKLDIAKIFEMIYTKMPSLKYKEITVFIDNEKFELLPLNE